MGRRLDRIDQWLAGALPPSPRVEAAAGAVALAPRGQGRATVPWTFGAPLAPFDFPDAPPWWDRDAAMSLPTISRGRDLICSLVAQLPLTLWNLDASSIPIVERRIPGAGWFDRPDPDRTRQWVLSWTTDDLIFYGRSHWLITRRYADSFPSAFCRIPPGDLTEDSPGRWTYTDADGHRSPVDPRDVVEFLAPTDGILDIGYRTISIAMQLDAAADRFAGTEVPAGVLEEQDLGQEDISAEELTHQALMFSTARQANVTAATNRYFKYREVPYDASKMQLVEGRTYQALELARVINVPPYLVGAPSGTGMTYQNGQQARQDLVDFGAQPYISCIEQTLSGPNVTPRGNVVRLDLNVWLRNPFTTNAEPSPNDLQVTDPTQPPAEAPVEGTAVTIHATFTGALIQASETKAGSRTITGLAVPWDLPGRVSDGTTVVFHPGSLAAGSKPVALRDHDRTRPIGTVTDSRDTSAGMFATITVSKVPAGDEALILAGDGALPALSVGAEPTDWDYDADGTLHVHAADWLELSLLTLGAFSEARVGTVTAAKESPMQTMSDTTPDEDDVPLPVEPDDGEPVEPDDKPEVETSAQVVPITAARRGANHPARIHPYAHVGIRELSGVIHAAAVSGDSSTVHRIMTSPGARAPISIEAALTDVTLVGANNVGAIYRPGYQAELVDIVSWGSPAVDAIRQGDLERGDYPNKTFNRWTTLPTMATQSAEKVAIASGPAAVTPTSVPVTTIAGGNDVSQQLLDFGSPSFIEDYVRAAGMVYAQKIDIYAVNALLTASTPVTTVANDNLVVVIGKLLGAVNWNLTPAGALFALVSPDLAAGAYGVKASDGPAFWDGNINFGSFPTSTELGGLTVQVDTNLPAKTAILGPRNAATWYDLPGTPFSLRAINVTNLGLDIAVYGYCALGVQYPGALVKTTVP